MRVTRITLDHNLGLIELHTGPGGDGDYVLLPLELSDSLQRYIRFAGEPATAEEPGFITFAKAEQVIEDPDPEFTTRLSGGTITFPEARGDQHVHITDAQGRIVFREAGTYEGFPEGFTLVPAKNASEQEELNIYLSADSARDDGYWDRAEKAALDADRERHTGKATCPDPVNVFAHEHSRGYRLTCPALPHWKMDINRYDLSKVPGMIAEAFEDKKTVAITIIEETD